MRPRKGHARRWGIPRDGRDALDAARPGVRCSGRWSIPIRGPQRPRRTRGPRRIPGRSLLTTAGGDSTPINGKVAEPLGRSGQGGGLDSRPANARRTADYCRRNRARPARSRARGAEELGRPAGSGARADGHAR